MGFFHASLALARVSAMFNLGCQRMGRVVIVSALKNKKPSTTSRFFSVNAEMCTLSGRGGQLAMAG